MAEHVMLTEAPAWVGGEVIGEEAVHTAQTPEPAMV